MVRREGGIGCKGRERRVRREEGFGYKGRERRVRREEGVEYKGRERRVRREKERADIKEGREGFGEKRKGRI